MVCALVEVTIENVNEVGYALFLSVTKCVGVNGLGVGDTIKCPLIRKLSNGVEGSKQTVLLCAVAGVSTRREGLASLTAVRQSGSSLTVYNVGSDCEDRCCSLGITIGVALLQLLEEGAEQPYSDIVSTVVVVTVSGEVTIDLEVSNDTVFVTDALNLSVLDSGQGVNNVGEASDTGCECTRRRFCSLISK